MSELYCLSAAEQLAQIRAGELSCRELVEAHLKRIDEVNRDVNAVTVRLDESALAMADQADRKSAKNAQGALHGIPFTVKESIDCVGSATTLGIPALEHSMPSVDAPIVAKMKAAGAIPIARTNMPEMGMRLCTDNPLRGATFNPWNSYLTPGGSSGGDAVALATGMTPIGLGNDIGGSLRNPAFCCGIASLKPTLGRIARATSVPPSDLGFSSQAMLVDGPMARSVKDLALTLAVVAGRDQRDPRSVDVPLTGPLVSHRRVALVTELPGTDIAADIVLAVRAAGDILRSHGWVVEEVQAPEVTAVNELWAQLLVTDLQVTLRGMQSLLTSGLFHHLADMCRMFNPASVDNQQLHATRSRLMRSWSNFLTQYPVMICPTWTQLPWPVDADLAADGLAMLQECTRFITPANVLGLPALSVPMGIRDGLPGGVQVYADLWREDLCLEVGELLQQSIGVPKPIDPQW